MVKNNEGHVVRVAATFVFGGYAVSCKKCGKIGRGVGKDKKDKAGAKKNANAIAKAHRQMGNLPEFKYGPFGI